MNRRFWKLAPPSYKDLYLQPATRGARVPLWESYLKQPGFWADYDLSGSVTNFIFQMGTTYYVSSASAVNLYGTTTIEGGSIIKFTNSPTTELALLGPLVASTGPYRMAVLTSRNDDSYGTTISGSTGAPTN